MKLTSMLAAAAAFAILTGCESPAPGLLSVEPVATAKDTAIDSALVGTWQEQGGQDPMAVIRPGDSGGYAIRVLSGSTVLEFQAMLFRVKDDEFLDLAPADDSDFRIPGHAVMRLWIDGPALKWAFLDSDWLKQRASALAVHTSNDRLQVFSPTAEVRAFVAANGTDDRAYGTVATWERVQ
ncbi:MAG TPA: hypothetical protein VMB03_09925 [Bryobacteraceae bacterium]|nr:hypothetical protein [Bryobacteraceae bacterium]